MRQGIVYVRGIRAGLITETDSGECVFAYDAGYLLRSGALPVSLTLPLRPEPYHWPTLFPFFFNMLSEGANREAQSQLLHIDRDDDFGIMLATAHTDTAGVVTVKPA